MKNILNKNLNDILYLLTPPIIYRKLIKSRSTTNKTDSIEKILTELQNKKFNYFFDESIIDEFCNSMRENFIDISSTPTKNKNNQKYVDELKDKGYVVIKNIYSKGLIDEWKNKMNQIIDEQVI